MISTPPNITDHPGDGDLGDNGGFLGTNWECVETKCTLWSFDVAIENGDASLLSVVEFTTCWFEVTNRTGEFWFAKSNSNRANSPDDLPGEETHGRPSRLFRCQTCLRSYSNDKGKNPSGPHTLLVGANICLVDWKSGPEPSPQRMLPQVTILFIIFARQEIKYILQLNQWKIHKFSLG